jgi:hypothetical protein
VSVTGALIAFSALLIVALSRNGWVFEYPLDDVYIHLAMAEQIGRGGYGVNAAEYASAASSPLYPFLFAPFEATALQRWLPLVWNIASLSLAAALLGAAFGKSSLGRLGLVLALVAPLALSMNVTAYTGMENMAHGAASLAIVLGLWRFVATDRVGILLVLGVLFAPAFRLEGLALAMAAGGVVLVLGRPRAGLGLMVLGILPVAAFAGFLTSLGLDPMPNSVSAKLGDAGDGPIENFVLNTRFRGGIFLFALSAVVALISASTLTRYPRSAWFGLGISAAGMAHLAFGAIGWMDRYENYAVLSQVAAMALLLGAASPLTARVALAVVLAGGLYTYTPHMFRVYAWNVTAIAAQQGEMARFAKEYLKAPIAVNDIGYVAWRNPDYVLDLWGLASADALGLRGSEPGQGWAGPLAKQHRVALAMVYDRWLGEAVPDSWAHLGKLTLDIPDAFIGGLAVSFYATDPTDAERLRSLIKEWEVSLPARAAFVYEASNG